MQIEEKGNIDTFEAMPSEGELYLTAIFYEAGYWQAGPGGMDKAEVIRMISGYSGITKARIYSVKVPLKKIYAA